MKRIIYILFTLALMIIVTACSSQEHTTSSQEPITTPITNYDCSGIDDVPNAYCGYEESPYQYDDSWTKNKKPYEGDYAYLNLSVFNDENMIPLDGSYPIVKISDCAKPYENSAELLGFVSEEICVCQELKAEQYYYDINEAIKSIDFTSDFREVGFLKYNYDSNIGLAFKDTLFYEAIKVGKEILSIPICYRDMYFTATGKFYQNDHQVVRKMLRKGERNVFLKLFVSKIEEGYILSVSLDGLTAYGYVLND